MKSFKLFDFSFDAPGDVIVLKDLYDIILREDSQWHFFWEGNYTVIRCGSTASKIERHLKRLNIKYEVEKWEDNIPITNKYQEQFQIIFHGFSELAMNLKEDEIHPILERATHCFLNNCLTKSNGLLDLCKGMQLSNNLWESVAIAAVLIGRAYTTGWIVGRNEDKKGGETTY